MLYYLFQWLDKYDFPGAGMFGYTSFRSLMAIILALLISSIWGDKFINLLKRKQITETQRDASIDPFGVNKVGVPSMGGVIIIFAILIPCLLLGKLSNIYMILMLITTIWLGSLGFADDYIKIFKKDKEGLHGKFKIIGQVGLGLIVGLTLYLSPQVVIRENIEIEKPDGQIEVVHAAKEIKATQTTIPFFKSNNFDYADLVGFMGEHAQTAGWILFVIITIFVVTAVSNGANLNDGMDGMAAGNSAIIGLTLGILAYVSSHIEYAGYLNIMYIPGSEELVIFICAFIGALIGFLWYNAYPAPGIHGRYGQSDHWRNHRSIRHHYSQGTADTHPLRYLPGGEPFGHPATPLLQGRQAERRETTSLQKNTDTRPLPHFHEPDRAGMQRSIHQTGQAVPRIQNHHPLLDCDDCIGSDNDYNIKD